MILKIKNYKGQVLHGDTPDALLQDALEFERLRSEALKTMAEFKAPLHINQVIGLEAFRRMGWIDEETVITVSNTRKPTEPHQVISFSVLHGNGLNVYGVKITPEQVTFKSSDPELSIKLCPWAEDQAAYFPPFFTFVRIVETVYGSIEPYSPLVG